MLTRAISMQRRSFIAGTLTLTAASSLVPWEAYASSGRAAPLIVRGPRSVKKGTVGSHVTLLLPGEGMILGRGKGADLRIAAAPLSAEAGKGDVRISRRHLAVRVSKGTVTVEDLGSGNGTRLDGRVLKAGTTHRIQEGHRLTVADTLAFRATLLVASKQVVGVRLDQEGTDISYVLASGQVGLTGAHGQQVVSADATKLRLWANAEGVQLRKGSVQHRVQFDAGDGVSHGEAALDMGDGVSINPKSFDAGDGVSHARRYEIALAGGTVGIGRLDIDVARFVHNPKFDGFTFIGPPPR